MSPTSSATCDRLIQAAKKLFARKGFDGTTVKDIVDSAEVNISAVSYHFEGKEGLYRACLEHFGKSRLNSIKRVLQAPSSREEFQVRLQLFIEDFFQAQIDEPELSQIVAREADMLFPFTLDIFKETFLKFHETLVEFFEIAQKNKLIRDEIEIPIIVGIILGGILHISQKDSINQMVFGNTLRDPHYFERVIQQTISFCLRGCYPTSIHLSDRSPT